MSGGQNLNESDIFASKESISIFSTEDLEELTARDADSSRPKPTKQSNTEETQIREYVEEYKREVERKFKQSKANANFKLKRVKRPTVPRKARCESEQVKTEEVKYERISSRKTNKENHWTKKARQVRQFEPSFEVIGDAEVISNTLASPEKSKARAKSPFFSSHKKDFSRDAKTPLVLKKTKLKLKKEILKRLKEAKSEKSEREVSVESGKEKRRGHQMYLVERQTEAYRSIDSARELNFIDLRAQRVKADLAFLRKRYFFKKKRNRMTKKNVKESEKKKEKSVNLEAWRLTKMIYFLARLDKRHLQTQIQNPRSMLHRELIDGVLRLVGVNLDLASVFSQAARDESILKKFHPEVFARSKKLSDLEKQFRDKVFQTHDRNEHGVSYRDSRGQSTKYKDFSPEQLLLIRSKEVLIPPDNFSVDKSRPSSMKIHKTSSQNCYKNVGSKMIKKNNSSLGRRHKVMKPASFMHSNFMTMSGVNVQKAGRKKKFSKKGRSLKTKNLGSRSQRNPGQSDLWEDFLVKNVKTKIKKLNILKRDKGNKYSISINNNNFNNNINLINPEMLNRTNQKSSSPHLPKTRNQNYRSISKMEHLRKMPLRGSTSQNSKKFRQKNESFKGAQHPRKMKSLKTKKENLKEATNRAKLGGKKSQIHLDLANKHRTPNSSLRVKSSRRVLNNQKKTPSVFKKLSKKSTMKHLALNLPIHPKVPKLATFNKPLLNMDKSKYLLAAGYLKKNSKMSQIKSERQKLQMHAESLHCKQQKKIRSQCVNTSRKLRDSRTWLVSEDKISSHSKSLLRIKEKLQKKTDFYKLNNFLKKIKDRGKSTQMHETARPKNSKFNSVLSKKEGKQTPSKKLISQQKAENSPKDIFKE